jgi:hypothetical protein
MPRLGEEQAVLEFSDPISIANQFREDNMTVAGQIYVHLPTKVEAAQWTGSNEKAMIEWLPHFKFHALDPEDREQQEWTAEIWVPANNVWVPIETGEWVLVDEIGAYPCKDKVFRRNYVLATEE